MNQLDKKIVWDKIESFIKKGISLPKCRKCGCMKDGLETISGIVVKEARGEKDLTAKIESWKSRIGKSEYSCLGCKLCYPAEALNILDQEYPDTSIKSKTCSIEGEKGSWPPIPGDYHFISDGPEFTVAVSTLASVALADRLYEMKPSGLSIVGKTETENIGIDKIVKNIITNPAISYQILAGIDSEGHSPGKTLIALIENGVDHDMRVIGSPGKKPILRNVNESEVEVFRKQVRIIDMIGCEDVSQIANKIIELSNKDKAKSVCSCHSCNDKNNIPPMSALEVIEAKPPTHIRLDKAGYFVIIPQPETGKIVVEHYSYDNRLQRTIEGKDARSIYWTIIQNGWITELNHAAYLGKELARAELSLQSHIKYIQDGA